MRTQGAASLSLFVEANRRQEMYRTSAIAIGSLGGYLGRELAEDKALGLLVALKRIPKRAKGYVETNGRIRSSVT